MTLLHETWKDRIRTISAGNPAEEAILEAVEILKSGNVIVFPTLSLYGLGADARNPAAVEKVFAIKKRSARKPLLVLVGDRCEVADLTDSIPPAAEKLMNRFWPGKITLVFEAGKSVVKNLTAGTGKIGIRLAEHPVARALCRKMGSPITATSANITGASGCDSIDRLDPDVAAGADLILDVGRLKGGAGSTVVDVTVNPPLILREGNIPAGAVYHLLG